MADDEEKKPLKHFKFKEFSVLDSDLTVDEIRQRFAEKQKELDENIKMNNQKLVDLKADNDLERADLKEQQEDLGKDPQSYHSKMKRRYEGEVASLDAEFPDKSNPEYVRRLDLINARYEHALDENLLKSSPNDYVNKVMDKIEGSREKMLKDESLLEAKNKAENEKLSDSSAVLKKQQALLEKNPELYAKLYNIMDRSPDYEDKTKNPVVAIKEDGKGQPCLSVILREARIPGGFIITDGKINFSEQNINIMTLDTMRNIIDYLDRRGIKGIELPSDINERLRDLHDEADKANREAEEQNRANEPENPEEENAPLQPLPENENGEPPAPLSSSGGYTNQDARDFANDFGPGETVVAAQTHKLDYGKTEKDIENWVLGSKGLHKKKGWNAFKSHKRGGWTCWSLYDQGNVNNPDLDGKVDKEGYMKVKYAFKLYSRVKKDDKGNPRLEVRYAMPNGKKINEDYAEGMMHIFKGAGITHLNYPDGLPESDESTFRIVAAAVGIVPMLKNLNEYKVKKMLEKAEAKLGPKDLLEYKLKLANWMEECALEDCSKTGKDFEEHRNATFINSLKAEYDYQPFRDMYEKGGGIRKVLEDTVKANEENDKDGLIKVVGASAAAKDLFEVYKEFEVDKTKENNSAEAVIAAIAQKIQHPNPAQLKQDFLRNMAKDEKLKGKTFNFGKSFREMTPNEVGALMKAMLPQEEELAKNKIDAKFKKSIEITNSGGIGDKESTITNDMRRMARENITNIDGELKDAGVKGIYTVPMGYAEYDYSELRQKYPKKKGANANARAYDDDDYER